MPSNNIKPKTSARKARGNMIIMVGAFLLGLGVFLLFALSYARLLGGHGEQKTAIEAAALAAAGDVSRIVILDPNFGYVSFSDVAPVGTATKAPDNYYMPVSSINTLMGTIRLDLTIANALNNPTMQNLAKRDLANLLTAKNNLVTAVNASLAPGGSGLDANGNTVTPYADALSAYNHNPMNMTGKSVYVAGSLNLSMGSVPNSQTNIPIPNPANYANANSSQQSNGFYLSNVAVPTTDGTNFVFAGLGNAVGLVDFRKFVTAVAGLPIDMPSVIMAQADQTMDDNGTPRVMHCAAAAQPSNVYDPRPAPGALAFSFPDGVPPELTKPGDLLGPPFTSGVPVIGQSPTGGDYPPDPGSTLTPITWTGWPTPPDPSGVISGGIYDWLKRGGPRVRVDAMLTMQTTPFLQSGISADNILTDNLYSFDSNGNVIYSTRELSNPGIMPPGVGDYNPPAPDPISVVSDHQMIATALGALASKDLFTYDAYVRDTAFQPGTTNGGKHGGEPLTNSVFSQTATHVDSSLTIASADLEPLKLAMNDTVGSGSAYDCGGSSDGAHWGISIGGPPSLLVGGLNINTLDGHQITFYVYANAPLTRNDFGLPAPPAPVYFTFAAPAATPATRQTYLQNGMVTEVRFRRAVPLAKLSLPGFGYGQFGLRKYPPPPPYPISNTLNLP